MFEITGNDIACLGDADLRTLVARLALAELASQGLPRSAVTAGGHQDAKDGGIDVRVETAAPMPAADFVPRKTTGFQVKRPDMPVSEIRKEMRPQPEDKLRPSIMRLAENEGAYIIVGAQGSVADQPLKDRRQAMRDALADCADEGKLYTDFYDRERLANWTNLYPGAASWVRQRIGAPLAGWRTIGTWSGIETAEGHSYLVSEQAKVIGEGTAGRETYTIPEGLDLLRVKLGQPRQCVRLIGMSGVGKTRFVEALFETGVGDAAPLDPALSVYTDFAEDVTPSAREMARRLVETGQRAILVVDNCNPTVHGELSAICAAEGGQVSLLTVEYDVSDDEPEKTEVFRLTNSSGDAIEAWIRREFSHVSQVDRRTIAGFSDGNFRVARALAETLARGETLGTLRSQELFARLFQQRNQPDQRLLRDAEVLALVYSFNGEDEAANGELAALSALAGRTVRDLFAAVGELRSRDIIQSRGQWRAVLPQAIANRLAASALKRLPPSAIDGVWQIAPTRLVKSMSRRIGYLHDSAEARSTVSRWLDPAGPLGNLLELRDIGLEIVTNLAPASPDAALRAIEAELDGPDAQQIVSANNRNRGRWTRLIRALAYNADSFERASRLLARFVAAEPANHNMNSARSTFSELFHIHLSGTRAPPRQRIAVAGALLKSNDAGEVKAGIVALGGLLKTSHFTSSASFDFGARPRDFGWNPTTQDDIDLWFGNAVNLAIDASAAVPDAKSLLGRRLCGLWRIEGSKESIEAAAEHFLTTDGKWIDGWIGLRAVLRWDGVGMGRDDRSRIEMLVERLKPVNLLERSRAVVLSHGAPGFDLTDGEEGDAIQAFHRASDAAVELGKAMAIEEEALSQILPEISDQQAPRAFEFGKGLALGTSDLSTTWTNLARAYKASSPETRNATAMCGFLSELRRTKSTETDMILEAIIEDEALQSRLPFLQSRATLDPRGLDRLRRLADSRAVPATYFSDLACGVVDNTEPGPLVALLQALEKLEGGVGVALDILHMRLRCAKDSGPELPPQLVAYGRTLLTRIEFGDVRPLGDYGSGELIEFCFEGPDADGDARLLCHRLRAAVNSYQVYVHDTHYLITALLKTQLAAALDCLVDPDDGEVDDGMFEASASGVSPFQSIDTKTLVSWANVAPGRRYLNLGRVMPIFEMQNIDDVTGLSPQFLEVLEHAPDKAAFLGSPHARIQPGGWAGSLALNLEKRKKVLERLTKLGDAEVDAWFVSADRELDSWIARERERETAREETFE